MFLSQNVPILMNQRKPVNLAEVIVMDIKQNDLLKEDDKI
jgi:hypothetical protein